MNTGPALTNPRGIAHEANGTLIVADFSTGEIFRVNPETGERSILSNDKNSGPKLNGPAAIVVLDDGSIYVSDTDLNEVIRIDPVSGDRVSVAAGFSAAFGLAAGIIGDKPVLVVSDTGGAGAAGGAVGPVIIDIGNSNKIIRIGAAADEAIAFTDPRSVAIDANGDIYVGEMAGGRVIKVTEPMGAATRSIVSPKPDGAAGQIIGMKRLSTDRLLVMDFSAKAVVNIDLATGRRRICSGAGRGSGIDFMSPGGIEVVGDHLYATDFGVKAIIEIEPETGDRTVISDSVVEGFVNLRGLMQLSTGNIAVADFGGERLVLVDGTTGDRTVISNKAVGRGPHFGAPVSVAELPDGSLAVSDFANEAIYRVDIDTGDRAELSVSTVGIGPTVGARGIILDPVEPRRLIASTFGSRAIVQVDIKTGERQVLSSATNDMGFAPVGTGIGFRQPLGVSVAAGGTIYVSDIGLDAILAVDPETGDRKIISGRVILDDDDAIEVGTGPLFGQPFGLALMEDEKSILIADAALHAVIRVDLKNGNRAVVSGPDRGSGPHFVNPFAVRLFESAAIVSDYGLNAVLKVDLTSGDRTVLSGADVGDE